MASYPIWAYKPVYVLIGQQCPSRGIQVGRQIGWQESIVSATVVEIGDAFDDRRGYVLQTARGSERLFEPIAGLMKTDVIKTSKYNLININLGVD